MRRLGVETIGKCPVWMVRKVQLGSLPHGLDILGEPVASHCAGDVGRPLRRQWPGKDRGFADGAPRMPNETREQPLHLLSGQIISFQGRKVGSRPAPLDRKSTRLNSSHVA